MSEPSLSMPAQVSPGSPPGALDAPLRSLTERERDVLALVAEGHSNVGISEHLGVAIRTVETHTSRIFMKLDLADGAGVHRRVLATLAHVRATQVA